MNTEEVRVKALTLAQSRLDNYKSLSKKTDLERTKEFLDSLGILYATTEDSITFGRACGSGDDFPECDKVSGYPRFYTSFQFDKDGNFLIVGAWE